MEKEYLLLIKYKPQEPGYSALLWTPKSSPYIKEINPQIAKWMDVWPSYLIASPFLWITLFENPTLAS